jgi:hypothetical protein
MTSKVTKQDIFDAVAIHLLEQGERSWDPLEEQCLYRGPNGLKCAVGALISDDAFDPDANHQPVDHPQVRQMLRFSGVPVSAETVSLLSDLQAVHDLQIISSNQYWNRPNDPTSWPEQLEAVARQHGLSTAVLGGDE